MCTKLSPTYKKVPVDSDPLIKPEQKQDEQKYYHQPWCDGCKVKEVKSSTISRVGVMQCKARKAGKC